MPSHIESSDSWGLHNGNRWLTLDEKSKYAYLVGFFEGMFQGHCFTTWGLPDIEKSPAYQYATESYNDHWNRFVAKVPYRQFLAGLDMLYAYDKNRLIKIKNALWIVMNEISGLPSGTIESMSEAWRQKTVEEP